jgi:GST-like protein
VNDLNAFAITGKWPPRHPDRIQLYTMPTANGVKVAIFLEEAGLPYEAHKVDLRTSDQLSPEFRSLNPNGKLPAIIDPAGPGGQPLPLFESGAILLYLAEKCGFGLPASPAGRYETIQWLMFQMSGVGPMFGQFGFFNMKAGSDYADKRPLERYAAESRRLLAVLDQRLAGNAWVMGDDYTIADIAIFHWVRALEGFSEGNPIVRLDDFSAVRRALDAFLARPGVQRGVAVPEPHPIWTKAR